MSIALFPLIVALVGLLMWLFGRGGHIPEIGKIMFFCGLLGLCLSSGGHALRL